LYQRLCSQIFPELIRDKDRILVAVSGGPDSVALGHILWRYVREESSRELAIAFSHVHHGMRRESDAEALLVQKMAAGLGVPCFVHRFDAKEYAALSGQSFQAAAREWRYARWQEDCRREGYTLLATAHHLGDQAETLLYRLLRGSGTAGLSGIYPRKGILIRPLLDFSKEELLAYCAQEGLAYALDSSNLEPLYDRNRIRLELLPELARNYNPQILAVLGRTAKILRWDEEFLEIKTEEAWQKYYRSRGKEELCLDRTVFQEPAALLSRLLRRAAAKVSGEPRGIAFSYVEKIIACKNQTGWSQDLPGLRVEILSGEIRFSKKKKTEAGLSEAPTLNVPLPVGEWVGLAAIGVTIGLFPAGCGERQPGEDLLREKEGLWTVFNARELAAAGQPLVCRFRAPGDKMWFKAVGHKELKKIFQEAGVPAAAREKLPLIAVAEEVLWIPGVRRGDRYAVGADDPKLFCIVKNQLKLNNFVKELEPMV
jgi:tRNA(Ile)-lysidine synthase